MERRCVMVSGGPIEAYEEIRGSLSPEDYYIYCDGGLKHREKLGTRVDLAIGDFDSHPVPEGLETIVLPKEKDDTDTFAGVKEGLKRGFRKFILLGATGARLDHTLANVSVLLFLRKNGAEGIVMDDWSEMSVVLPGDEGLVPPRFKAFSTLALSEYVTGVTIINAKYPLEEATISNDWQFGVSNEVLLGKTASIKVKNGSILLIKNRKV